MLVVAPIPLPDSEIAVGLLLALLVTVTAPVRVPAVVGVNRTVTVQDEPAAMLVPQVLVWLKSPDVLTALTGAAAVPLLVTVTAWVGPDVPVATEPKPTAVGLTEMFEPLSGRYGGKV